jgi:hypothetical protein
MKKIIAPKDRFAELKGSGHTVLGGKYNPGILYKIYSQDKDESPITAKCTSWFGINASKCSSSFIKQ